MDCNIRTNPIKKLNFRMSLVWMNSEFKFNALTQKNKSEKCILFYNEINLTVKKQNTCNFYKVLIHSSLKEY